MNSSIGDQSNIDYRYNTGWLVELDNVPSCSILPSSWSMPVPVSVGIGGMRPCCTSDVILTLLLEDFLSTGLPFMDWESMEMFDI